MENEIVAEENVVISDEHDKVTVYREEVEQEEKVNEYGIDTSAMPAEVKKAFEMMADTLKTQKAKLDELTTDREVQATSSRREVEPVKTQELPKLKDQLKFEDGDYYAKFLLPMADAIDNINSQIKGLSGEVVETRKTTFEDKVKTFFDVNKVDKPIVKKMDEIASRYGGSMYSDLPKLLLFAKAELGIKEEKRQTTNPRNITESSKIKKGVTEPIKVTSMKDAFKKALNDLEE